MYILTPVNNLFNKTYRCHRDDCPPVSIEHCFEGRVIVLLLEHVDEGGEHDGPHPEEKEEEAQLLVVRLHCVPQGLESG